jgi:hypothetical protein
MMNKENLNTILVIIIITIILIALQYFNGGI